MQHEMQTSIEKITSFFKNKFDIFKNKLLPKSSSDSTIISIVDSANISTPQSCKKITTSKHNNNNLIYTSSVNIKHSNNNNNKVDSTNINMQPDTITVTTTTTTTVTTIHNTHTHTHTNLLPYHINYECKHIVDYSKYTDNIVSSLIGDMIDDIEVEHSLVNNKKDKKILQKIYEYYDRQRKYSGLKDILTPDAFNEFEQIVNNILCKNPTYLVQLHPLKRYQGDLSDVTVRYGVFETNNFVVKIDDECDIFMPEVELMSHFGNGIISPHNIVLPYYVRMFRQNEEDKNRNAKHMHFSIQPRIKNTLSLRKWMNLLSSRCYSVSYYIKMCITVSKSILFMHSHNIVHGDIKPDNILIDISNHTPYIIDFGLSGLHKLSKGTGGTQPFCCPETKNCSFTNNAGYVWTKNRKQHDLWSIAFIFSTIIIFKDSYNYYYDYPGSYFTHDYYVNVRFLSRIPIQFREPFIIVLSKKSDINLSNFITLLEEALASSL
jgi:hypothetical protein